MVAETGQGFRSSISPPGGKFMLSEIERLTGCGADPHTTTPSTTSTTRLFFDWANKPPHPSLCAMWTSSSIPNLLRLFTSGIEATPRRRIVVLRHFIRQGQRLPRDVQDPDLDKLFAVIPSPRDRAMFLLMLRCGLRVGEVRHLSMNDLYLQPTPGNLPRAWLHGKNGSERVVYLSAQPLAALRKWLEVRPSPAVAVFVNRWGERLTVTGIQDRLAHYCRVAGVWITCHQFRHTFGRDLAEARSRHIHSTVARSRPTAHDRNPAHPFQAVRCKPTMTRR
jgi:integrase